MLAFLRSTLVISCTLALLWGCSTTRTSDTARTGMEQLLLSNAIDQSLDRIPFLAFQGRSVYVDEKYLDCVDKGYVLGTLRHRLMNEGARLAAKPEEADVVMEVRSGGVGTDNLENFIGIPGMAVPGPMPIEIPEVKLWNRSTQMGTAKIGILAYDRAGRPLLNQAGTTLARSDDSKWFVMGVGPFESGTVHHELDAATGNIVVDEIVNVAESSGRITTR